MKIGCHVSVRNGHLRALHEVLDIGASTMQFFSRNPRGFKAKKLNLDDAVKFKEKVLDLGFGPAVAHAPYTLNLASNKDDMWQLAQEIIIEDIQRLDCLGIPYLVLHPGNHIGSGVEYGIERIALGLKKILGNSKSDAMILLETMSGSGTEIGGTFEEINAIINSVEKDERLGVCMDTCHIFAAGYNVDNDIERVFDDFDGVIGKERLKAIHVNDSLSEKGNRKDRHADIGEGMIGMDSFDKLVNHKVTKEIPLILETPEKKSSYKEDIKILKNLKRDDDICPIG